MTRPRSRGLYVAVVVCTSDCHPGMELRVGGSQLAKTHKQYMIYQVVARTMN